MDQFPGFPEFQQLKELKSNAKYCKKYREAHKLSYKEKNAARMRQYRQQKKLEVKASQELKEEKEKNQILTEQVKSLKQDNKNITMKYRYHLNKACHLKEIKTIKVLPRRRNVSSSLVIKQSLIQRFYEKPDISTISPYKSSVIKKFGQLKRKRFLQKTHKEVYRLFEKAHPAVKVGFTTFYKNCPFWIVQKKMSDRNTCACIKHVNFSLLFLKARSLGLVENEFESEFLETLVCDVGSKKCAFKECDTCKRWIDQKVTIRNNEDKEVSYFSWGSEKDVNGKVKCIKKKITLSIEEFREQFLSACDKHLEHEFKSQHQARTIKNLKKSLTSNQLGFHVDWSENYEGKHPEEPQSMGFGTSRPHISLHTGGIYRTGQNGRTFGTASDFTQHGAIAICAHLKPILERELLEATGCDTLQFYSDSPFSQYRNINIFDILIKMVIDSF